MKTNGPSLCRTLVEGRTHGVGALGMEEPRPFGGGLGYESMSSPLCCGSKRVGKLLTATVFTRVQVAPRYKTHPKRIIFWHRVTKYKYKLHPYFGCSIPGQKCASCTRVDCGIHSLFRTILQKDVCVCVCVCVCTCPQTVCYTVVPA